MYVKEQNTDFYVQTHPTVWYMTHQEDYVSYKNISSILQVRYYL
jgi:hypothetical protein